LGAVPTQSDRLNTALSDRYRVVREVGAGGMATVYLANDLKHDRDVAMKVLHPDLGAALGGDRFLGEIKTTAKLQHPHILPLLDSGAADGLLFYVMPLVEGETLRARLMREKQLPIDAAVRIAIEIAGALDYAHRHGVIHRDIKPENILLHDGRAVVADFGIALAVSAASGSRMTQTGLSLGTPQYMSPEQATGEKHIDARSDVYALGAVLYEMLTGEPPFSGATVQAIVAKVLTERPMTPSAVRDTIPPHVEFAVLKALAKLPADRHATAIDFARELERPQASAGFPVQAGRRRSSIGREMFGEATGPARFVPWGIAAVALGVGAWFAAREPVSDTVSAEIRAELPPVNETAPTLIGSQRPLAISEDGSQVAFVGVDRSRVPTLFVRSVGSDAQWTVPDAAFGESPAFSPDGKTLAYGSNELVVIAIGGTATRELVEARREGGIAEPRGSARRLQHAWASDSAIVFARDSGLFSVQLSGGAPELLVSAPDTATRYQFLKRTADGRAILMEAFREGTSRLAVFWIRTRTVEDLGLVGTRPQLVNGDVLVYVADGALRGITVDRRTLRPTGSPVVITDLQTPGFSVRMLPVVSANGVIVFGAGGSVDEGELVVVDRTGAARMLLSQRQAYRYPRFSPDGRRLAFGVTGGSGPGSGDVWTLNVATGTTLRVTSDTSSYHPEWTPDGRSLMHIHRQPTGVTLRRVAADGGAPVPLLMPRLAVWEMVATPDRRLVFRADMEATGRDIFVARLDSPKTIEPLLNSRFDEKGLALSPDGRWLAYSSDEGGPSDVYIRRLDRASTRWRASQGGGVEPRWSRTGELFFRRGDSLMVARVGLGADPSVSEARFLFRGDYDMSMFEPMWDVSPDGRQFVFVRRRDAGRLRLMVMVNWLDRVRNASK
jgi:serine/threonine-protein kinase